MTQMVDTEMKVPRPTISAERVQSIGDRSPKMLVLSWKNPFSGHIGRHSVQLAKECTLFSLCSFKLLPLETLQSNAIDTLELDIVIDAFTNDSSISLSLFLFWLLALCLVLPCKWILELPSFLPVRGSGLQ
jgi:hypothetical protein